MRGCWAAQQSTTPALGGCHGTCMLGTPRAPRPPQQGKTPCWAAPSILCLRAEMSPVPNCYLLRGPCSAQRVRPARPLLVRVEDHPHPSRAFLFAALRGRLSGLAVSSARPPRAPLRPASISDPRQPSASPRGPWADYAAISAQLGPYGAPPARWPLSGRPRAGPRLRMCSGPCSASAPLSRGLRFCPPAARLSEASPLF